jgi:murein DD-endopeptidase MepM/ murein hydrolase activator NlpD
LYAALIISTSAYIPSISSVSAAETVTAPNHIEQPILKTQSGTRYPVDTIRITTGYKFYHPGLDLDGITGDPIYPFMSGKIETIEYSRFAYGTSIIVNHGNGVTSRYAHLSKVNVEVGQQVDHNTVIGKMGATGRAFGDHLHFEIYENGKAVNPITLLPKK